VLLVYVGGGGEGGKKGGDERGGRMQGTAYCPQDDSTPNAVKKVARLG
jgi:hypothetical protein